METTANVCSDPKQRVQGQTKKTEKPQKHANGENRQAVLGDTLIEFLRRLPYRCLVGMNGASTAFSEKRTAVDATI